MAMRPPTDQRAEVRQDRIVQKHHIDRLHHGPQQQHGQRHEDQLGPMFRPHLRRIAAQQIDDAAHVVDQPNLDRGDKDRHQPGEGKDLFERLRIVPQKGPEPLWRHILLAIGDIGIDEVFKKAKHGETLKNRRAKCSALPNSRAAKGQWLCQLS